MFTEPFPSNRHNRKQGEPINFLLLFQNKESTLKNRKWRNRREGREIETEEMYSGANVPKLVTSCNTK